MNETTLCKRLAQLWLQTSWLKFVRVYDLTISQELDGMTMIKFSSYLMALVRSHQSQVAVLVPDKKPDRFRLKQKSVKTKPTSLSSRSSIATKRSWLLIFRQWFSYKSQVAPCLFLIRSSKKLSEARSPPNFFFKHSSSSAGEKSPKADQNFFEDHNEHICCKRGQFFSLSQKPNSCSLNVFSSSLVTYLQNVST